MHNWYQNCIFINRLKPNVMDNVKVNFKGSPVTLVGTHLQTGDKAPRFTVLDGDLQPVSLSQYKDKNLIISVFPSVDTSVCALQNIRFNKEASKLKGDVEILSISVDLPFAQNVFALPKASTTCMYIPITATSTSV